MEYSRTKIALLNRLDKALRNLYHNATPHHPSVPDKLWNAYWDSFNFWAECEVDYISDGLGGTNKEYEKERKKGWPNKGEREAWLVSRITEFGKLYTWGRGGRTLAPNGLINMRGGSSFGIKSACTWDEYSNEHLTDMIQVIEAFNDYVQRWNSKENLARMWQKECQHERSELASSAKDTRQALRKLARDAKALAGIAGESACNVLRQEISRQRAHHKELVQRIANYNEALKEA